jgi:hypothetical protein
MLQRAPLFGKIDEDGKSAPMCLRPQPFSERGNTFVSTRPEMRAGFEATTFVAPCFESVGVDYEQSVGFH